MLKWKQTTHTFLSHQNLSFPCVEPYWC